MSDPTRNKVYPHLVGISRERTLWRAVLVRAFDDAECQRPNRSTSGSGASFVDRDRAREWLLGDYSGDFASVCDSAGLDRFYVRSIAQRYRREGRFPMERRAAA